jgi:hypothetical protein
METDMKFSLMFAASALALAIATAASAHATWIAMRGGEFAVVHGDGGAEEAYDPDAVSEAKAMGADGAPITVTPEPVGGVVRLGGAAEAAVLTAAFAGGWWTEDAAGEWHNVPPDGIDGFKSAGEYFEYPVTIVAAPAALGEPLGNKLEIVPLVDPTALEIGADLPVQVFFEGKPLAGAEVAMDVLTSWDPAPKTDGEGKTTLKVANEGFNVAAVYHEIPTGENVVQGHSATLAYARVWPEE